MILSAKQLFDRVYLMRELPSEVVDYISYGLERELINKLIQKLEDHKLYVVQLLEPKPIDDSKNEQVGYRQDLNCFEIVQCKNCRMHFPWCQKFKFELDGNGFCPYGAEIVEHEPTYNLEDGSI